MQRTIEHQSWIDCLGAEKCAKVESAVDDFLKKFPKWEDFDSQACKNYQRCVEEKLVDSAGIPMNGYYGHFAEWSWRNAIYDIGVEHGGNDNFAIYALRYSQNEWVLAKKPSLMDHAIHYYQKTRGSVGKIIPALKRNQAPSFADFEF